MTWKWNVKNDNDFACSEGKTSFWEKTCNFSKWRKTGKQAHKTKTKEKNTFENNSKNANMQCTPKMKFEFGTWGRTKNIKMKEKLHI